MHVITWDRLTQHAQQMDHQHWTKISSAVEIKDLGFFSFGFSVSDYAA